ncbi:DNA/RNA helicase domain-containing protein [Cellvibrio sp. pealriver]|uniref:DNA/RNA helicase domain-containing protein n=1 Tax=Cellvibrio sp. pealriver TaxID=1622269 RepID=UPI00066FEB93|nr:DNA/RNA helicase domain-containing protein [Cellvibrio sp. pealriver]
MLVYSASKDDFVRDIRSNRIEEIIQNEVSRKLNRNSPKNEILSWKNSLDYMFRILVDPDIPPTAGVAIEYNIPLTNRRVDFILTGKDANRNDTAVIIELKQWQEVDKTQKDGIVKTFLNGGIRETNHPSYQAWSYAALITDYNETVRSESISLQPCAYLHNLKSTSAINDPFYSPHTDKAPVFISDDAMRLSNFLKQHVKYGDSDNIMYRIEHGVIKPSKTLADSLASMLKGKKEFILLDEQKLVYETALDIAHKAKNGKKQTLIVKGGPGTGKSVVAINLLVELTNREMVVQYTTKNSAPREVFKSKLTKTLRRTAIDNLFRGTGSYVTTPTQIFDALIVDEAHRLNEKSGLYANLGENQIKEIINSSNANIFFIDEDQRVTFQDIGSIEAITQFAQRANSEITILQLDSQFRCNGSDGYIAWLDNTLQIRETANADLSDIDYEFKVFDNPAEMRKAIFEKNKLSNKARIVAGYCWDWKSKKEKSNFDITFPEFNFEAKWNLTDDGSLWMISPNSVNEIGCIHTCQGLEVDYIGVIIGPDFVIRDSQVVTDAGKRSSKDKSIKGYKSLLKSSPVETKKKADQIIKNTYRTLMTRGIKGCYLYCTDPETNAYFSAFQQSINEPQYLSLEKVPYEGLGYAVVSFETARPYDGFVPVFDIAAAAGSFSPHQDAETCDWVELPEEFATKEGMFVIRVIGESMNRKIPDGSWCLFKSNPGGTRNGKVVLVQHNHISDVDHGGSFTVKVYKSEKRQIDDQLIHEKIVLSPDTNSFGYSDIVIKENDLEEFRVIGEFVAVL